MLNNIKYVVIAFVGIVLVASFMTDKGTSGASTAQLDQALGIASNTFNEFENTPEVNESNVMDKFTAKYNENLNAAQPPMNANPIGIIPQADGALLSFDDTNSNGVQDPGEKDLFKMEVDGEGNRLIASTEGEARESGFSGSGLLMGMLIGNMMSRQRTTGTNPAARKATAKGSPSARSRSGSGSHSRGK